MNINIAVTKYFTTMSSTTHITYLGCAGKLRLPAAILRRMPDGITARSRFFSACVGLRRRGIPGARTSRSSRACVSFQLSTGGDVCQQCEIRGHLKHHQIQGGFVSMCFAWG
jgi:hypothetical protein